MTKSDPLLRVKQKPNRWKRVLIKLSLVVGSVVFSLLLCELILRLFSSGYSPMFLNIYRMDDDGILMLIPNVNRRHLTGEFDVTVTTNSEGLRDRSSPVKGENGTILGVGDSMAFGMGVELDQSFYYLAEEALRPSAIRFVKAGIPATGTIDQLRWLQHYGERYNPRLVVLSFCAFNDFTDNQVGGVPAQYTVRDGDLVRLKKSKDNDNRPAASSFAWQWEMKEKLKRSSLLAQKAAEVLFYFEKKSMKPEDRSNPGFYALTLLELAQVHLKTPPAETAQAIALTLQLLDEIHQWCQQRRIPLVLMVIPRSFQIYDWELVKWKEAYKVKDSDMDLDRPQRVLAEWAAPKDVAVVDLLPPFRTYQATHPDERLFFYPDVHLNANGTRLAGAVLSDVLKELLRAQDKVE